METEDWVFGLIAGVAVIAIIGGLVWALSPSKPKQEASVYTDVASCSKDHPADECQKAFDAAQADKDKAPKFSTQSTCEDVYGKGQCVPRGSGGATSDGFSPFMTGFMMGHLLSGGGYSYQPVYIDRSRHVYSGGGYVGSFSGGRVTGYTGPSTYSASTPSAPRAGVAPSVSARGGFGSTAGMAAESAGG